MNRRTLTETGLDLEMCEYFNEDLQFCRHIETKEQIRDFLQKRKI